MVALVAIALLLGGVVKGVTGIGLPIVGTAILSNFLPGQLVLALIAIPLVLTNLWQAIRAGDPLAPLRRFWPLTVALMGSIWLAAGWAAMVDSRVIYGAVGVAVLLFLSAGRLTRNLHLGPRQERWAGVVTGILGGVMGGLSTVWGPPIVPYLLVLRLGKDEFIQTVGWVWLLGAVPLAISYAMHDILTLTTGLWSLAASVPAFAGMFIGQAIRNRIDEARFQRVVRLCLGVIAINLLRRALFT